MATLADDIRNEGNRQPTTVVLNKLDEKEILLFIKKIQLNTPRYQLARNNCSHIIAQCLQAGSVKPSFTPTAKEYGKLGSVLGYGIWTPEQVSNRGITKARSVKASEVASDDSYNSLV